MKIGAHVSSAGSIANCFERAEKITAECFQTFFGAPQQWNQTSYTPEVIAQYQELAKTTGIGPNFIHGTYLINLGAEGAEHLQKSIDWLTTALQTANTLGIQGVIFHLGSHKGRGFDAVKDQVITALKKILDQSGGEAQLILETSAGAGGNIGGTFEQLAELVKGVDSGRLKICLDTCHVYSAGYDVKNDPAGVAKEFDRLIGLDRLVVCHLNDSKGEFKSGKDRHENVGEGTIGLDGFKNFINDPDFAKVPLILEVPGFEDKGPDQKNIDILRSLVK